jgi:uncharacterized protein YjbJ (UPF0337 family)
MQRGAAAAHRRTEARPTRQQYVWHAVCIMKHTVERTSNRTSFTDKTKEKPMSGKSDKAEGRKDKVAGKLKEETGDALDDKDLETRGKAQKVKGDLKERKGTLKDAAR